MTECPIIPLDDKIVMLPKEEYTLAGFIESYNNIKNKLTKSLKN